MEASEEALMQEYHVLESAGVGKDWMGERVRISNNFKHVSLCL